MFKTVLEISHVTGVGALWVTRTGGEKEQPREAERSGSSSSSRKCRSVGTVVQNPEKQGKECKMFASWSSV